MIKNKLRSKILKLRKFNSYKKLKINPNKLFSILKKNKFNFKSVGGYYPYNYEVDDLEILDLFRKKKFNISLPIIKINNQMDFYEWSQDVPLKINKYGIIEPISLKKVYPDLIFVPLVAYDRYLNRLGYGGGFYDRYIERVMKVKNVIKIGFAYSYQELNKIPTNTNDKRLDFIVTEKEII